MMHLSIYELKLGIESIAQFTKFCAKIQKILHIAKKNVHYFRAKGKIMQKLGKIVKFLSHYCYKWIAIMG